LFLKVESLETLKPLNIRNSEKEDLGGDCDVKDKENKENKENKEKEVFLILNRIEVKDDLLVPFF